MGEVTAPFKPKLRAREPRPTGWPLCEELDWLPARQVEHERGWGETTESASYKRRVRKRLLERWGEHPMVLLVLKWQKHHEAMMATVEELLMSILERLDLNLPLSKGKEKKS